MLLPGVLFATILHGQGTFVYDQQSSDESYFAEGGGNIQENQPIGQSFTPSLSTVGFVRLQIYNGFLGDYTSADVVVHLRSNSITGPLLGTSAMFSIPGGSLFANTVDFVFSIPVTVTPGTAYFFQPEVLNNSNVGLNQSTFYNYAGGILFAGGVSYPNNDIWFREGIIVPEPSLPVLLLLGGGTAAWLNYRRRRLG